MAAPASKLHEIVINAHDLAPTTRASYLRDLNQWIAFAGAAPSGWTRRKAADFYTSLLARPMKPQSANRLMASIAYASRWWAHYEHDPTLDFGTVQHAKARDKKPQHALDEDAARRLLATCDDGPRGLRDFALIVVGLETGMRRVSLTGMMLEDTAPATRWPYPAAFVPLKGKDPAWVPLSDTALIALQPWLDFLHAKRQLEGPLFRPIGRYITPDGKPLSPSMFAKIFDERAKAAGLPHINPHLLRHTFITWREAQGLAPHEIAAITYHDLAKALGALGGYMDTREIGGRVRNHTPVWLAELVRQRIGLPVCR